MRYLNSPFSLAAALAVALLLCLGSPIPAQAQAVSQIGIFDLQKALQDSKKGKAAETKLTAKFEALRKGLEAKAADLEKKKKDLDNQAATLNSEALEKRRMELSRDINAHIEENQRASDEMQKASNEAMSPLMDKVEKAIEQLAKERGLALILEVSRGGVAYFDNALDITAEITKAIDK